MSISKDRPTNRRSTKRANISNPMSGSSDGQVIVLMALSLIVLMGIVGLAIDGGTLFFTQRNARNAADAAVLAGGYTLCSKWFDANRDTLATEAAENAAEDNGFGAVVNPDTNVVVQLGASIPDDAFEGQIPQDKSNFIRAQVWANSPTYFIQLLYTGPSEVTVDAIARCQAEVVPGPGDMSIVVLSYDQCRAFENIGTGRLRSEGGIWVNSDGSDQTGCGGNNEPAYISGTGQSIVCEPGLNVFGGWVIGNSTTTDDDLTHYMEWDPNDDPNDAIADLCSAVYDNTPTQATQQIDDPLMFIDPPDVACGPSGAPAPDLAGTVTDPDGDGFINIYPGRYSQIKANSGETIIMSPGFYCIDSPNANAGIDTVSGQLDGEGVVIYLKSGSIKMNSNMTNRLTAPSASNCFAAVSGDGTCDWTGMLIYSNHGDPYGANANGVVGDDNYDILISGSGGSIFTGTVYAPFNECILEGNSGSIGLGAQLICETVQITGTGDLNMYYDPTLLYTLPPSVSISK